MRLVLPCTEAMLSCVVARGLQEKQGTELESKWEAGGCQENVGRVVGCGQGQERGDVE